MQRMLFLCVVLVAIGPCRSTLLPESLDNGDVDYLNLFDDDDFDEDWTMTEAERKTLCEMEQTYPLIYHFVNKDLSEENFTDAKFQQLMGNLSQWLKICKAGALGIKYKQAITAVGPRGRLQVEVLNYISEFSINRSSPQVIMSGPKLYSGSSDRLNVVGGYFGVHLSWKDKRLDADQTKIELGFKEGDKCTKKFEWYPVTLTSLFNKVWYPHLIIVRNSQLAKNLLQPYKWIGTTISLLSMMMRGTDRVKDTLTPPSERSPTVGPCASEALLFPFDAKRCFTFFSLYPYGTKCEKVFTELDDRERGIPHYFFLNETGRKDFRHLHNLHTEVKVVLSPKMKGRPPAAMSTDSEWLLKENGVQCMARVTDNCMTLSCVVILSFRRAIERYVYAWFVTTNLLAAATIVGLFGTSRLGERFSFAAAMMVPFTAFIFRLQQIFPRGRMSSAPLLPLYLLFIFANSLCAMLCANIEARRRDADLQEALALGRKQTALRWIQYWRRTLLLVCFLSIQLLINVVCFSVWFASARSSFDMTTMGDFKLAMPGMLNNHTKLLYPADMSCPKRTLLISDAIQRAYNHSDFDGISREAFSLPCQ